MKIKIEKRYGGMFVVDPVDIPGSPLCGWGRTMDSAMGDFLRAYQKELGLEIELSPEVQKTEMARRRRELAKR
jgi:hypothetical protein